MRDCVKMAGSILMFVLLPFLAGTHSNCAIHDICNPTSSCCHLKGCHKGDQIKGIRGLEKYLDKFGYLNYRKPQNQSTHADDDDFFWAWE